MGSDFNQLAFLEKIKPIIIKKAMQYGPYIKGYDMEDLVQEGQLIALQAFKDCKINDERMASIFSWTWIRVHTKFAELAKMGYNPEESMEDYCSDGRDISNEDIDACMGQYFESVNEEEDFLDTLEEMIVHAAPEKLNKFLQSSILNGQIAITTAQNMKVTTARISQIKKLAQDCFQYNPKTK